MGSTITPTYRVEMFVFGYHLSAAAWRVRSSRGVPGNGRPTDDNLATYVADFEASCKPGGVNAHLRPMVVRSAKIVKQSTGFTVATYQQPMFSVV